MFHINQIEAALNRINQATFQTLITHLLHLQGYTFIGAPGAVVGKDKTSKGIPDSFFMENGKFIFVECTTKEKVGKRRSFLEKLLSDIESCFNEQKTKIPSQKIAKIILACTQKISPAEIYELEKKLSQYNGLTELKIIDIQNLPMQIWEFPSIASEYLQIKMGSGEVYDLPSFLTKTTKGIQPPLTNEFIGREKELKEAQEALKNYDVLLLSGPAGVGKSKLAVQVLQMEKTEGFNPVVIQSSGVELVSDFFRLFEASKDIILLFDDANKSAQNLAYLLDFIQQPREFKIKVIITVREYVKRIVEKKLSDSHYKEISVGFLEDDLIEKIILNVLPNLQFYPDHRGRIISLAKGNVRLALMATYSVTPGSDINYLGTPLSLYEKYFEKVSTETEIFSRPIILQALAIVSFFGVLEKQDEPLSNILEKEFGIEWNNLWSAIIALHENEIINVHENDIAKVSDQVLATYAFYKCFLDPITSVINYRAWVKIFIDKYTYQVKNSLIDINNTFTYQQVQSLVLPYFQEPLFSDGQESLQYKFHSVFWLYKCLDALNFVKKWIDGLPHESVSSTGYQFEFTHNNHTQAKRYFEILIEFWRHNITDEYTRASIQLAMSLVEKQPNRLPEFLKFITEEFSYTHRDSQEGYLRQNLLFDELLKTYSSLEVGNIAMGSSLVVSEKLLGWQFNQFYSKGRQFTIQTINLRHSMELSLLRGRILENFFIVFHVNEALTKKILKVLVSSRGEVDIDTDKQELPFYNKLIHEKLTVDDYSHSSFVDMLAKRFRKKKIEIPAEWERFLHSEVMELAKFLSSNLDETKKYSMEERFTRKREQFKKFVADRSWPEVESFLHAIDKLLIESRNSGMYSMDPVSEIYIAIAKKGKEDIKNALSLFFDGAFSFSLNTRVIDYAIGEGILNGAEILEIVNNGKVNNKEYWVAAVILSLPIDQINENFLTALFKALKEATGHLPIHRMNEFVKCQSAFEEYLKSHDEINSDHNIITFLTELQLNKGENISLGYEFCKDCSVYFVDHMPLLKQAYYSLKKTGQHFDYHGEDLKGLLDLDRSFLSEYFENRIAANDYLSFRIEDSHFDFVWDYPEYMDMITATLMAIAENADYKWSWEDAAKTLFAFHNPSEELLQKAESLIGNFMKNNYSKGRYVEVAMDIILYRFREKYIDFLKELLLLNDDVTMFRRISFERGGVFSGSRIPHIQKEIEFYQKIFEMLRTLPDILRYSEHIQYVEDKIIDLRKEINREVRSAFRDLDN